MTRRTSLAALALIAAFQLAAAGWSIVRFESVLTSGVPYRMRTHLLDPADTFRGRYVAVETAIPVPMPVEPETERLLGAVQGRGARAYVLLGTDAEGFASAADILAEAPVAGDYLEIATAVPFWGGQLAEDGRAVPSRYTVGFSFNRYYMNEAAAPIAERLYVDALRRLDRQVWAVVRVRQGIGVIEGLYIDGVPIEQAVASAPAR